MAHVRFSPRLLAVAAVGLAAAVVLLQTIPYGRKEAGGLKHQGYFEVFDAFISSFFGAELQSNPELGSGNWTSNSAHIRNVASRANVIVVPHGVENPRGYLYDPNYLDACVENGLGIILFVHTLAKYAYFLDPRPTTPVEKKELFLQELRVYEEKFRPYREHIMAIYVYDEPWVHPHNVTPDMVVEMCESARSVFWNKPVMVVFHRQGNTYSYALANGTVVSYDDYIGSAPQACDIIGVDPYFYAYHDDDPPNHRHTGDKAIVESDLSWACGFNKPVVLVGQAFDPGSSPFFDSDNTDPKFSVSEGFEKGGVGGVPEGWSVEGSGIRVSSRISRGGTSSLSLDGALGSSAAALKFPSVHSAKVKFQFMVEGSQRPKFWIMVGDGKQDPVRLGFDGREMLVDDGSSVEIINRSVDVRPGIWHSVVIDVDADGYRWTVWFDGEPQTRLPYATLPKVFSTVRLVIDEGSGNVWLDDLEVWRDWSFIPLNEEETMFYYDVARRHPQVQMLLWYNYAHSFASSLVPDRARYQVANVWAVQHKIWEMIG